MTPASETITRLATELASWETDLARKQELFKGFKFNTKKDERWALAEIADFTKVVESRRRQLNSLLAKA